jgi:rfaE bifunctional protein kinase chain/domain
MKNKFPRILVVGDAMLDHYTYGQVKRISPEAPVPVVEFENERFVPGGAANVAANLAALGAQVVLFGLVGHDPEARKLVKVLEAAGVEDTYLAQEKGRATTLKQRVLCGQQIVRIDRESHRRISAYQEKVLIKNVYRSIPNADAIIISDYAKGTVTQGIVDAILTRAVAKKIPVVMNMKPANTINPHRPYVIQLNRREAFELASTFDDGSMARLRDATALLSTRWEPAYIVVTLGGNGVYLYRTGDKGPIHIPTEAKDVIDVSGAGDTFIAAMTFSLIDGYIESAVQFANKAAGIVVSKHGTATVTLDEL